MTIQRKIITYVYITAVGLIVSGLCLRFGGEKFITDLYFKKYNDSPGKNILNGIKYTGIALYICGWLTISICLALRHKGNIILRNSIFSGLVISAIWAFLEFKEEKFVHQPKLPLISCSVLLTSLVALITLKRNLKDIFLVVVASFLIIFAEYFVLPFQRKNSIHDGLGLPLLLLGWLILFHVFNGEIPVEKHFSEMFKQAEFIPLQQVNQQHV